MTEMEHMWRERRANYWDEATRYLRLIGNSGFMFSLYVAFLVGAYYYGKLLNWLPESFPSALFFSLVSTLLLVRSPVRTFLKEADLVFLLPLETEMDGYFRKSIGYSFLLQSFTLIFVLFILSPFYLARIDPQISMFVVTVVWLLAVKYWNISASWQEMHLQTDRVMSILLRTAVTFVFTWLLFRHAALYFLLALVLMMVLLTVFYFRPMSRRHTLKWDRLLAVEEGRLMAFYRMANLFTEVPRLKNRIKPRRFLSAIVRPAFGKKGVFLSLYFKTFIRANDYFGTYMRLLVIGAVVLFLIPDGYGQLLVMLLILYISGMQLYTMWGERAGGNWEALYPIADKVRVESFLKIVSRLLLIKTVAFVIVLAFSGMDVLLIAAAFVLGIVFSWLFSFLYLQKKMNALNP